MKKQEEHFKSEDYRQDAKSTEVDRIMKRLKELDDEDIHKVYIVARTLAQLRAERKKRPNASVT